MNAALVGQSLDLILDRLALLVGQLGLQRVTQEGQPPPDPMVAVDDTVAHWGPS
jgi:hypothetical protein